MRLPNIMKILKDIFMWGGNKLNQEVYEWMKYNLEHPDVKIYESDLWDTDKQKYYIFKYKFTENKNHAEIAEIMGTHQQRVDDAMAIICHHIQYGIKMKKK